MIGRNFINMMISILLFFMMGASVLIPSVPVQAATSENLIENGGFESGLLYWNHAGNFYAEPGFSYYHTGSRYAYLSQSNGQPGSNLYGDLYQTISIPSSVTSATLTFWLNVTSVDTGSSPHDVLSVSVRNSGGSIVEILDTFSNLHRQTIGQYQSHSYNLDDYIGQTIQIGFLGTTDSSLDTVFRLDDVSVTATIADPVIDASIDSYTPSSKVDVTVGKSTTIGFYFTNTGNTAWNFIAGATVWDSSGTQVANYSKTLSSPLQPGDQTYVSWSHPVNAAGEYWVQFGVWKATPYINENLLDRLPSPSGNLIQGFEAQTIDASIDSYIPSSKVDVTVGESTTIGFYFTNTGNTAWTFIAGATVWDSSGTEVANYSKTLSSPLQPGSQTYVSWSHPVNNPGEYYLQFGVWKATPYIAENLLARSPSPSANLIRGVEAQTIDATINSYNPSSKVDVTVGESTTIGFYFTNTGNTAWTFIAGASVWDADGNKIADYERTLSSPLQPGDQTSVSWSHLVNDTGDFNLQFGVWKATPYIAENLLDKSPSPYQQLIHGVINTENNPLFITSPLNIYRTNVTPGFCSDTVGGPCLTDVPALTYFVGDSFRAAFSITNRSTEQITIQSLGVRGTYKEGLLPNGEYPEFPQVGPITLIPEETYVYSQTMRISYMYIDNEGYLQIGYPGDYHFYCALKGDDGIWLADIEVDDSLTEQDTKKDISLYNLSQIDGRVYPAIETSHMDENEERELYSIIQQTMLISGIRAELLGNQEGNSIDEVSKLLDILNPESSIRNDGDVAEINLDDDTGTYLVLEVVKQAAAPVLGTGLVIVGFTTANPTLILAGGMLLQMSEEVSHLADFTELVATEIGEQIAGYASATITKPGVGRMEILWLKSPKNKIIITFYLEQPDKRGEIVISVSKWRDELKLNFIENALTTDCVWNPLSQSPVNYITNPEWAIDDVEIAGFHSPGEIRVYDSSGRMTGTLGGSKAEEIPYSVSYDNKIIILAPDDTYRYEIEGTSEGTYGIDVGVIDDTGSKQFIAEDVYISDNAIHNYSIDWNALSSGTSGITISKDSDGNGEFEQTITTSPPNIPDSPSPADGASEVELNSAISWIGGDPDAGDTVSYQVYIGTDPNLSLASGILTECSYLPGSLEAGTTYYWQIIARDNNGITTDGPVWSFTTESVPVVPPETPTIISPVNGQEVNLTPVLVSSDFSDPYDSGTHLASQWQIAISPEQYANPVFDSGIDTVNLASITIPQGYLEYDSLYFCRVKHQDDSQEWSEWSGNVYFYTDLQPAEPTAAAGWGIVNSPSHILTDVDFIDAGNGWMVGSGGTIIHTMNGGVTAILQQSGTEVTFWGVSAVDANHCWVVGDRGTILSTTDGGFTWTLQTSTTSYDLFDVRFLDDNNGWACGIGGIILHTTDGGTTWAEQESNTNTRFESLAFTDLNNGWIADTGGVIRHTADGGSTWTVQYNNPANRVYDVFFLDANNGWASGYNTVLKTTDGGDTWSLVNDVASPLKLYFSDVTTGQAASYDGKILKTVDGGTTWSHFGTGTDLMLMGISYPDTQTGYVVGEGMSIFKTTDAGSTWTAVRPDTGPSWILGDIEFVSPDEGWAAVQGRRHGPYMSGIITSVFHTVNGGLTWTPGDTGIMHFGISMDFTDQNNGWIGGYAGQMIHTSDGGGTWTSQTTNTDEHIFGMAFINPGSGWACGGNGMVLHTENGGTTWTQQREDTDRWLYDIYFTDENNGWAVGGSGEIIHTSNGGASWEDQVSGSYYNLDDVFFTDAANGWIVGIGGIILHTSDGGATWTAQQSGTSLDLNSVRFADPLHGYIAGDGGTILLTADGGNTWEPMVSNTGLNLAGITIIDGNHAWAAGEFGIMLNYTSSEYEDFVTYTRQDPEGKVTLTPNEISFNEVNFRGTDTYVYNDKGEGYFSGDFEHTFTVQLNSLNTYALPCMWMLANTVDDRNGIMNSGGNYLDFEMYKGDSGVLVMRIREYGLGFDFEQTWSGCSFGTPYYIKIVRDESIGDYGRLYCYIYSNSERTNLITTLQLDLHSKTDFRYIYGLNTNNDSQTYRASGLVKEMLLKQDWTKPTEIPVEMDFTWINGSQTVNQPGIYGSKGTPDPANVPGSKHAGVTWTDSENNLWLFGGHGYDSNGSLGFLNDLWRFDGINWTWVSGSDISDQSGTYGTKGIPDSVNVPGPRAASITWTDSDDNLWLFGGECNSNRLNDLWKFDGMNWTWMGGSNTYNQPGVYGTLGVPDSTNIPGARRSSGQCIDKDGNLWLFGGVGIGEGQHNDLWKFDGANWTWMGGSNTLNDPGNYGTKGISDPGNMPSSRYASALSIGKDGSLLLFGGLCWDTTGTYGYLNDLWKFDGTNWVWINGTNIPNNNGSYGTKGIPDSTNLPKGRAYSVYWCDRSDNLWIFGGRTFVTVYGDDDDNNDLWKFNGANWTWMAGPDLVRQPGVYGESGISDPVNIPGARSLSSGVKDAIGNVWLFGGYGIDGSGSAGYLNDLWNITFAEDFAVWNVDDDLNDNPDADFTSIQAAVDAARAEDIIRVYPGTYSEDIVIITGNLTIQSVGGADTTIVQAATLNTPAFTLNADRITLQGFTIRNSDDAVFLNEAHYCTISDNVFLNNADSIYLKLSSLNEFYRNHITGHISNGVGSSEIIFYCYDKEHYNNLIDTSNTLNEKPVYYYFDNKGQTLAGCQTSFLMLAYCSDMLITGCNVTNGSGIRLEHSTDNRLYNNSCSNNYAGYLGHLNSHSNALDVNSFSNNLYGIALSSGSGNTSIRGNQITGNIWEGISLGSTQANTLYFNELSNNEVNISSDTQTNTYILDMEVTYRYGTNTFTSFMGNYYDDFSGADTDGNGIGDTPYAINNEDDAFPLMAPYTAYEMLLSPFTSINTRFWEDGNYQLIVFAEEATLKIGSVNLSGPSYLDSATVHKLNESHSSDNPKQLYNDGMHWDGEANDRHWSVVLNLNESPAVNDTIDYLVTYASYTPETLSTNISGVFTETARLLYPTDKSVTGNLTPTFGWTGIDSPDAVYYSLQIEDLDHNRVFEIYHLANSTRSYTIPSGYLSENQTYYWFVAVTDNFGNEAITQFDTFTTPTYSIPGDTEGWILEVIDSIGNVGDDTCLAFDNSGNPGISYYDLANENLKYAHFNGISWEIETVDTIGTNGRYNQLAYDISNKPIIAYYNHTDHTLKCAWFNGSFWDIATLDSCYWSYSNAMVLDSQGYPIIAYYNYPECDLKLARFNGMSWEYETVYHDGAGSGWGRAIALDLDSSGYPGLAFRDLATGLRYMHWNGTSWDSHAVDSGYGTGADVSLRYDYNNNPCIVYYWQGVYTGAYSLKVARYIGQSWDITLLEEQSEYTSLAYDSLGNPCVSYYDSTNEDLKYASLNGSEWERYTIDSNGNVGLNSSLAFNVDGNPVISYFDLTNQDLKLAKYQAKEEPVPGDVNGDGTVNVLDITKVARIILERDLPISSADTNQDGNINVLDITRIVRIILKLE